MNLASHLFTLFSGFSASRNQAQDFQMSGAASVYLKLLPHYSKVVQLDLSSLFYPEG